MENYYFSEPTPTGGTTINYVEKTVQDDIEQNENRDRYVAARFIYDNIKEGADNITITQTDLYCPFDLSCSCTLPLEGFNYPTTVDFNVEIKERNKSDEQLKKYPNVELRVAKYRRMKNQSKGKPLFYLVLLNEKIGYLFNITNIDKLKGVYTFNWRIKQTQLDPNSEYVDELTYSIPVDNAIRTEDISKYYTDYYNANYTED